MKFTVNGVEGKFELHARLGRLDLMYKEENGDAWFIVGITEGGKLIRYKDVPNHLSFVLAMNGRVKVDKGYN